MNTLIISDFRAYKYNGKLYVGNQFSTIAKRYHINLGQITFVARITETQNLPVGHEDASDFIKDYYSVNSLLDTFSRRFRQDLSSMIEKVDLVILRCPSIVANSAYSLLKQSRKPYMVELMGDAWDAYWNHGSFGKLIAPFVYYKMKKVVKNGNYALYVTERFLQDRYPCLGLTIFASNVLLTESSEKVFNQRLTKLEKSIENSVVLMTIGAVNVRYKGQEFVIKAIPKLNTKGIKVRYILVGGGDDSYLRKLATELNVIEQVEFMGRQPLDKVFTLLDETDIYLQPSLQEGLPRSVIEALSRGCHVCGANTAGIPELIDSEFVFKRKNSLDIVNKIEYIVRLPVEKKISLSRNNFENSKKYLSDVLDERRSVFFLQIIKDIHSKHFL